MNPTDEQQARARLSPAQLVALKANLKDRWWRLTSGKIYKIAPADGSGVIPFIPSNDQKRIFRALLNGCKKLGLPKCRRPGFSTALGLFALDMMVFLGGVRVSLVDQNQSDASRKLDEIVGVALDNLPGFILARITGPNGGPIIRNGKKLSLRFMGKDPSTLWAGMNARGGSNDLLWVSEWGVIQFEDPKRSSKIRSGGLPSARHGITVIETTWAGGKAGDVYEVLKSSLDRTAPDWEIQFSPWQNDARNVDATAAMDETATKYFEGIADRAEREGITFTDAQKRWWAREKREQGIFMNRENPTFLDEMWRSPVQGSVYAEAIDEARSQGRVDRMPIDGNSLVHTWWDLGAPRQTRVVYGQVVGRYLRIIKADLAGDETIIERVARMKASGLNFGMQFFPHDAAANKGMGTLAQTFANAWLGKNDGSGATDAEIRACNVRYIPRCHDTWVGVNHLLQLFPSLEFTASENMEQALQELALFRVATTGPNKGDLVHDEYSHIADAFRYVAESHLAKMWGFKHVAKDVGDWDYLSERGKRKAPKTIRVGG